MYSTLPTATRLKEILPQKKQKLSKPYKTTCWDDTVCKIKGLTFVVLDKQDYIERLISN